MSCVVISVLIPNYNGEPFIHDCIRSVVRQLDPHDEIVVVDDHSTDGSLALLHSLAKDHPNLVVSSNPRKGGASARNHAFSLSSGACIQWLDVDDFIDKDKLSLARNHIEHQPSELHACPWHPFTDNLEEGRLPGDVDWDTIPTDSSPAEWLARDTFMGLHCYAGHRTLFEKAGPWDESLTINQDGEYFARVIAQSGGVHFTQKTEVYYRRVSSGSVSRFTPEKADSLFRSIESMAATAMKVESSERMEQMVSNRWQHFIYTVYPSRPDLIEQAESKLQYLPKPNISNPNAVSPLSRWISGAFGWKALTQARLLRAKLNKA